MHGTHNRELYKRLTNDTAKMLSDCTVLRVHLKKGEKLNREDICEVHVHVKPAISGSCTVQCPRELFSWPNTGRRKQYLQEHM